MSNITRTPTYDRSHYTYQPASSQSSQNIIDRTDPSNPAATAAASEASTEYFDPTLNSTTSNSTAESVEQEKTDVKPTLSRRTTFNYQNDSEAYQKSQGEDGSGEEVVHGADGRRGSVASQPFKPSAKRTKSWDIRDKRGEMLMSQLDDAPRSGFSEV